jgi:hypothetical protein
MLGELFFAAPFLFIIAIARSRRLGDWDDIIVFITLITFMFFRAIFQP